MRLYLSSFGVGDEAARLRQMVGGGVLALTPNAMDHVPEPARSESNAGVLSDLRETGVESRELDLRTYFGTSVELGRQLSDFSGVWVRGGNTFVLRRAMRMSGFDNMLPELLKTDFLYGGHSAGVCVLAPSMEGIGRVDQPNLDPQSRDTARVCCEREARAVELRFVRVPHTFGGGVREL